MFDLKRELAAWRARLEAEDGLRGTDIDELEDHLCEQVIELASASHGLSEEEAFRTATQRLGGTKCLAEEFGKVNGSQVWRRRVTWMISGWLVAPILVGVVDPLQQVGYLLAANQGWLSDAHGFSSLILTGLAVNIVLLIALLTVVLRVHGAGATNSVFARLLAWGARRWYWAATILILIPVVGKAWWVWAMRLFTMDSISVAVIPMACGALFWTTIGPLAVLGLLVWLRRRDRKASGEAPTWMAAGWLVALFLGGLFGLVRGAGFVLAANQGWLSYDNVGIIWPGQLFASLAVNVVGLVALLTVVLRIHGAGADDGILARVLAWSARRWYLIATILILIPVAAFIWGLWAMRLFAPHTFGIAAIAGSYTWVFWTTIGPLAVLGLLVWLRRRERGASRLIPASE